MCVNLTLALEFFKRGIMKDHSRNEGSRNVHHVPDVFEPETLRSVVKRATSEPRLQLPKCLQIFAIYALTLVMYTVASPGSTTQP